MVFSALRSACVILFGLDIASPMSLEPFALCLSTCHSLNFVASNLSLRFGVLAVGAPEPGALPAAHQGGAPQDARARRAPGQGARAGL